MHPVTTVLLALTLLQQPRRQQQRQAGGNVDAAIEAVASFDGVFKNASKKVVEVQVSSGDTMRMYITRSTKFIQDGHPVQASAFHDGDKVNAEAERDARMNLIAVKIEAAKPEGVHPGETAPKKP